MNDLKKNRTMRAFLSVLVTLGLAGCGGGTEGTGAGPSYQLSYLPERISPDLPKTLLRGAELPPPQQENPDRVGGNKNFSSRMDDVDSVPSDVWYSMRLGLAETQSTRLGAEVNSTIIDVAFDDIRELCVDKLIDCTIPSDQLNVKVTQEMINRFIELGTNWLESLPPEILADLETNLRIELELESVDAATLLTAQLTLLLDSEVVFGETRYSQLDGAPYDHSVQTVLSNERTMGEEFVLTLWQDQEFSARWNEDGHVAKFSIDDVDLPAREYFYQNNSPSEVVIADFELLNDDERVNAHVKLIANNPDNAGVLVEFVELGPTNDFRVSEDRSLPVFFRGHAQGQIDDDGGYATLDASFSDIEDNSKTFSYEGQREYFDGIGKLIAGTLCEVSDFDQGIDICEEDDFISTGPIGTSITDSPYFFSQEGFDLLTGIHDAIQWTVEGLPDEISEVAVVSADSSVEPAERDLLCRGFRFFSDDTRMFCGATDEQLANTIVLELVDGKPGSIIPNARLVQRQ